MLSGSSHIPAGHRILRRAPISITPLRSNAITLAWSFFDGSIDYNSVIPVSDASYEAIVGGELDTVSDTVLQFTGDQPLSLSRYFRKHPEFLNKLR